MKLSAALLLPLSVIGCASDNVIVQPVTFKPVPKSLMARQALPKCDYDDTQATIAPHVVGESQRCWKASAISTRDRLHGLQDAVKVRERAAARVAAASKP